MLGMRSILPVVEKSLRSKSHDGGAIAHDSADALAAAVLDPTLHQAEINAALQRVASHALMRKSPKLKAFLSFVVTETLAGRGDRLKAYSIAVAALGKSAAFDPVTDPIVRVEASRLRRFLKIYYSADGKSDPIRITMPTGSYQPIFERPSDLNIYSHSLMQDDIGALIEGTLNSDRILISTNLQPTSPRVWPGLSMFLTPRVQRAMLIANMLMMIFTILVGVKILTEINDITAHIERFQKNWDRHLTAQVE